MFCRQCEQTFQGKGCASLGVCGKTPDAAALQDLLVHAVKGIAVYGKTARELGVTNSATARFVTEALFTTVTNVDFDTERIRKMILQACAVREITAEEFNAAYKTRHGKDFSGQLPEACRWIPAGTMEGLIEQGREAGILGGLGLDEDIRSLREILLYGLKGMAAYADHAAVLGTRNAEVDDFFFKGLAALSDDSLTAENLLGLIMELGKVNLKCLEMLDHAHTAHFGNPEPVKVSLGQRKGPAILISGHDLLDLEQLLQQTEGKGITVCTHGEMLPAHGYPGLKKYKHFAGHYGTAWQNQYKEFAEFPGAILMTTNCIQRPANSYMDRIFTTGLVAWPGVKHIGAVNGKKDFSPLIKKAVEAGGFKEDKTGGEILVGFAHNAVLGVADKVIGAVKSGKIRHFFMIGGCDGARPGRNYYTEFAQKVPKDCVILTLACGKFRFNTLDFGVIDGIPRLLDCGQCNDAYSAMVIAQALAKAFGTDVNGLPLSLVLSWYEQKAVCILLTLLSLGIKNIRLGPSLPAFITPNVLKILVEKFAIKPISTPDADLDDILNRAKV